MGDLNRLVARASARLLAVRFVAAAVFGLLAAVSGVLLLRVAERLFAFSIDWTTTWLIAVGVGVVGALGWVIFTRADKLTVARELDERADLRESISTAMCVAGQDDPWSQASVEQARALAPKVQVARAFPVRVPRAWPLPLVGFALFFILGLIPRADLLKILSKAEAKSEQQAQIEQAKAQVQEIDKKLDELLAKVDDGKLKSEPEETASPDANASPEEIRREAVKKLTTMQDRLNELKSGDKSAALESMKQKMEQLKQPSNGPEDMKSMVKNLQSGKFDDAKADLDKLAQKLSNSELSQEQKEQLAKQLSDLAKQLDKLASQQKELEQALAEAGLDKSLASDPEALQKALDKMQNMSEEQKQQLQSMCKSAAASSKMCKSMSQACKNGAAAMAQGQPGSEGQMSELGEQLSEMEMMSSEMKSIDAAMSECKGQLAGLGKCMGGSPSDNPFASMSSNRGSGQRGVGGGQAPAPQEADFTLKKEKSTSPSQGGPIVGSMMMQGDQVRGESVQQFSEAVKAGSETAAEAIESMQVPREYHDALKHYFTALEKKAKEAEKK